MQVAQGACACATSMRDMVEEHQHAVFPWIGSITACLYDKRHWIVLGLCGVHGNKPTGFKICSAVGAVPCKAIGAVPAEKCMRELIACMHASRGPFPWCALSSFFRSKIIGNKVAPLASIVAIPARVVAMQTVIDDESASIRNGKKLRVQVFAVAEYTTARVVIRRSIDWQAVFLFHVAQGRDVCDLLVDISIVIVEHNDDSLAPFVDKGYDTSNAHD